MPTSSRPENIFIKRFLSAYEDYSWADANICWLDEQIDGAVEAVATRKCDGKTLAIEHTIIQPFVGEKEDFAFFKAAFLAIEKDRTLPIGRWIRMFIPVGTLRRRHRKATRDAIVEAVHNWLKTNRLSLSDGFSDRHCSIVLPGKETLDITLYFKVVPFDLPGELDIVDTSIKSNLGEVIGKALKRKLPKLMRTCADKRILFLERQHMTLRPKTILDEVENLKSAFPDLAKVDETWILETMFYERDSYLRFEHYEKGTLVGSLDFQGQKLRDKFENGIFVLGSIVAASMAGP